MALQQLRERFIRYEAITHASEIARRYFAMNAFDGAVTIIGVVVGSYAAGLTDARAVLTTGLATSMAIGVSGLWGAYLTEAAERERELDALERQTLTSLRDTEVARASRAAVILVSIVDGLSPLLAGLIVLVPFFVASAFDDIRTVYGASVLLGLVTLFGVGLFLGRVSRGRYIAYGLKTVSAGIAALLIGLALE